MMGGRILFLVVCLGLFAVTSATPAAAVTFNDILTRISGEFSGNGASAGTDPAGPPGAGGDAGQKPAPQTPRKSQSFIDPAYPLYACMGGFSVGAVTVAFPPVQRWVYVYGALPGMGSIVMRGGFGCYFGLVLGSAYSATVSTGRAVGDWWHGLFH